MADSRHGPGLRLNGGEILLNGKAFHKKPHTAISIALWMNLDETEGVHSLFDTRGYHVATRYALQVMDGRLRWFHRNKGHVVFSVITPPTISPLKWYHVVATYDSHARRARVFVDGSLVATGFGSGLLSLDWSTQAGFGIRLGKNPFLGFIDEIYMFRRALTAKEIKRYLTNLDTGVSLRFEPTTTIFPSVDSVAIVPTERADVIEEVTEEPSYITVRPQIKHNPLNSSLLSFEFNNKEDKDFEFNTKPGRLTETDNLHVTVKQTTKTTATPTTKTTTTTTVTTEATTTPTTPTTNSTTTPTTVTTVSTPPQIIKTTHPTKSTLLCKHGDIFRHDDLVGGLGSGNFTDKGVVETIEECMKLCCEEENCTVAYMVAFSCFSVQCQDEKLCRTYTKSPLAMAPVIGFVDRFHHGSKAQFNYKSEQFTLISITKLL